MTQARRWTWVPTDRLFDDSLTFIDVITDITFNASRSCRIEKLTFSNRLITLYILNCSYNLIREHKSSQNDEHVEHIWHSYVMRQGIISSDERSSSILYLLTASKCIRHIAKRVTWGAGRHIATSQHECGAELSISCNCMISIWSIS